MKLLVAVDFGGISEDIIDEARTLALGMGASVTLLHVAEPNPEFVGYDSDPRALRDVVASHFHEEHRALQAFAQGLRDAGVDALAMLVQGSTVETILREADKSGADMIVIGSHGKGMMKKLVLGSVSSSVLQKAQVPVLVMPALKKSH